VPLILSSSQHECTEDYEACPFSVNLGVIPLNRFVTFHCIIQSYFKKTRNDKKGYHLSRITCNRPFRKIGQKIVLKIGENRWKESADMIFTDTARIGNDPIPDTIMGRTLQSIAVQSCRRKGITVCQY
jgi:hypothetical protein